MLQIHERAAENGASCATNCFSPIVNPFNSAVPRHPSLTPSCCPLVMWLNKWFGLWKVILRDTSSDPALACSLGVHFHGAPEIVCRRTLSNQAQLTKEVNATDPLWDPGLAARVIRESSISLLSEDSEKVPSSFWLIQKSLCPVTWVIKLWHS